MDNSNLNSALHLLLTEVYGVREIKSVEIKSYEVGGDRKNLITFMDRDWETIDVMRYLDLSYP